MLIPIFRRLYKRVAKYRRKKYYIDLFNARMKSSRYHLSPDQERQMRSFYKENGGVKNLNPVCHRFYSEKTGYFFPEYIPDYLHCEVIDPFFNDWSAANKIDNKCYYQVYLPEIRQPWTYAMRINNIWFLNDFSNVVEKKAAISSFQKKEVFIKIATDSYGGHGVKYIPNGTPIGEIEKIVDSMAGDLVIQEKIIQHPELMRLNASSVNTVRVISLLSSDGMKVKIYSSILRMGINNAVVDNASSGGITCGILPDGKLKNKAFSADGVCYDEHPNSRIHFEEITVPNYNKIRALVKMYHPRFPHFRLISWDFAIDQSGEPVLIEVNLCDGEIDFHQLNNGPLFGKDTSMILQEVFACKQKQ